MNQEGKHVVVHEVWSSNLRSELSVIHSILPSCSFASFDTEFPGTIFTPNVDKASYSILSPSTNYGFMKANVDVLNIIQLGLTLTDSDGNLPHFGTQNGHVWQFNFRDFDIEKDPHNAESIQLLRKQGIDFSKYRKNAMVGKSHQAGPDSLLTLQTFMKLKDVYFRGNPALEAFQRVLYSLEVDFVIRVILVPAHLVVHS